MGHREVVVHEDYPHELRAARYWTHMMNVLSRPAPPISQYSPDSFWHITNSIGPSPFFMGHSINDPDLNNWMASDYTDSLATFGMNMTQSMYQLIAQRQGKLTARYFAEKHYPDQTPQLLWELYPAPREIFLVRDFRDMVSSMLSFNGRRGTDGFGRSRVTSDEAFVERLAEKHVRNLVEAWKTRAHDAILIRYEDVVEDSPTVLQKILNYLGLDASSEQVAEILEKMSSRNADATKHMTSSNPKASTGRWRQDLNKSTQKACRDHLGFALREFGYDD